MNTTPHNPASTLASDHDWGTTTRYASPANEVTITPAVSA